MLIIAIVLVSVTVVLHSIGTSALIRFLSRHSEQIRRLSDKWPVATLVPIAIWLLVLHLIEITIWAIAYSTLPEKVGLSSLSDAMYFSAVTYTTLGYGDITISGEWRFLSGVEAMNGIFLCGWSSAMLFVVVQRLWQVMQNTVQDR